MRDQAYMRDVVEQTAAIRRAFTATLRGLDYDPPESHTNFVLVPFASVKAARAADTQLRAVGLMARGMGGYGLGHCLRFTMGPQAAMAHAAENLASFKERINDI
jgi:histidinol-phosphate aminotransferase/N-methylhydantoinase B